MVGHKVAVAVALSLVAGGVGAPLAHAADGDGGPALAAPLSQPRSIVAFADGAFAFTELERPAIRIVDAAGFIRTLATLPPPCAAVQLALAQDNRVLVTSTCGRLFAVSRAGVVAVLARTELDGDITVTPRGVVWLTDAAQSCDVQPPDPVLGRLAPGADQPEALALFPEILPSSIAALPDGSMVAADSAIRRVEAAGRTRGIQPSPVDHPGHLTATAAGSLLVSDRARHVLWRLDRDGTRSIVAGTLDDAGFSGDDGPARSARLAGPAGTAVRADGAVLIADSDNGRIRRVAPDGTITTVAGAPAAPPFGRVCGTLTQRLTGGTVQRVGSVRRSGSIVVVRFRNRGTNARLTIQARAGDRARTVLRNHLLRTGPRSVRVRVRSSDRELVWTARRGRGLKVGRVYLPR